MLMPGLPTPPLDIALTTGERWTLGEQGGEHFTLLVFYRGLHCAVCETFLGDLMTQLPTLNGWGVNVLALSCDPLERAVEAQNDWGLTDLTMGCGLSIEDAAKWGLYFSSAIIPGESVLFSEPGVFLVRPDGELYSATVQTMPFGRPDLDDLVSGIKFIVETDYPARGGVLPPK